MFHHVPLSEGVKNDGYDKVANDVEASRILQDSPSYTAGFFDHSYHAPGWDKHREQSDDYGNRFLHVTYCHDLKGNTSIKTFVKLSAFPGTGFCELKANYGEQYTTFPGSWRGAGSDNRRQDVGLEAFRNRTASWRFNLQDVDIL